MHLMQQTSAHVHVRSSDASARHMRLHWPHRCMCRSMTRKTMTRRMSAHPGNPACPRRRSAHTTRACARRRASRSRRSFSGRVVWERPQPWVRARRAQRCRHVRAALSGGVGACRLCGVLVRVVWRANARARQPHATLDRRRRLAHRCVYDADSKRFFLVYTTNVFPAPGSVQGRLLLAVSRTSNPGDGACALDRARARVSRLLCAPARAR